MQGSEANGDPEGSPRKEPTFLPQPSALPSWVLCLGCQHKRQELGQVKGTASIVGWRVRGVGAAAQTPGWEL